MSISLLHVSLYVNHRHFLCVRDHTFLILGILQSTEMVKEQNHESNRKNKKRSNECMK